MGITRRQFVQGLALTACASRVSFAAFPERPVTIVVPLAAGGVTDIVARYVANQLGQVWKAPIVVENRPGAGGSVGAEYVAKARPDGYTLVMGTVSSHAINASLYQGLRYDNLRDFDPVSLVASGPNLLVVHPSVPVSTLAELIAYLKANPGRLSYGSAGVGTSTHVLAELFKMKTGTEMTHVPYKGSSAMMTDLVAGRVQLAFDNMPTALAQVRSGTLKPIAVSSADRWAEEPGIPTMSETVPGLVATSWQGLFAPAGTPPQTLDAYAAALQKILSAQATTARFRDLGTNAAGLSRGEFAKYVQSETLRWAEVVKASGARAG